MQEGGPSLNNDASYAIAAIVISILVIYYFIKWNRVSNFQNSVFLVLVSTNAITAVLIVIRWICFLPAVNAPIWVASTLTLGCFITHSLILPLLLFYTLSNIRIWREISLWFRIVVLTPISVLMVVVLMNPYTNFMFSYASDGTYCRERGIAVPYFVAGYYVCMIIYILIRYHKSYSFNKRITLLFVIVVNVLAVVAQLLSPEFPIEICVIAISTLIVYFIIQNPYEQLDQEAGVLSRVAFLEKMKHNLLSEKRFDLIEIVLSDYNEVERKSDIHMSLAAIEKIAEYLKNISAGDAVYRVDKAVFCIEIFKPVEEDVAKLLAEIKNRFCEPWTHEDSEILFTAKQCHLRMPQEIKDVDLLMGILKNFTEQAYDIKVMEATDFDLAAVERSKKITNALAKAIEKNNFEMRYTPIYSIKQQKIIGCEASVRFYDDELGYVYDEEIFHFVEKSGHMLQLGEMLFERTCEFVSKNNLEQRGIEFVGVYLLPAMCLQFGLMEKLLDIVERYRINPKILYIQISEYTVSKATKLFRENISVLEAAGMKFCLEGYGSGFTNIASIYEMPFSVLKLNKGVVQSALKNSRAKITMECTLSLAHDLNMMIMVEGIADSEFFSMISKLPCDYAKGNYFLEQIDDKDFLRFIDETEIENKAKDKGGKEA